MEPTTQRLLAAGPEYFEWFAAHLPADLPGFDEIAETLLKAGALCRKALGDTEPVKPTKLSELKAMAILLEKLGSSERGLGRMKTPMLDTLKHETEGRLTMELALLPPDFLAEAYRYAVRTNWELKPGTKQS